MKPKHLIAALAVLLAAPLSAQLYHPGEVLDYRVSYRARMFPNTEVGTVRVATTEEEFEGQTRYKVEGVARTLPTYRWFFNLEDVYTTWTDTATLRPAVFTCNNREGDYTFRSRYDYDWERREVATSWQSRKRPVREKRMPLTDGSMDAVSLFFSLRSASAEDFREDEPGSLEMVLEDTIRRIAYRYQGREEKKIRNMGRFRTLRFECQLGTSEGASFADGAIFTLWISDDGNKIPLYIESPVRVGSINAYISGCKGLKYPLTSKIR